MSDADNLHDVEIADNYEILDKLQSIVSLIKASPNQQIDIQKLDQAEDDLQNILPQLQFALLNAQEQRNWEQVNKLRSAVRECKDTLNSVRAAIVRATIIGINPVNLAEMQKILQEIKSMSKTNTQIDYIIYVLRFMRKLFL